MRRAAMVAVMVLAALTGCAKPGVQPSPAQAAPAQAQAASDWPAGVKEAEIYTAVLRRYLTTPNDNSIHSTFTTAYVLDRTDPGAPIPAATQQQVAAAVTGPTPVVFIADRMTVIEDPNGCQRVKGGGIFVELGAPDGDDNAVQVHVRGFVACLGGTELTYAVQRTDGTGWQVTGTVGAIAVA